MEGRRLLEGSMANRSWSTYNVAVESINSFRTRYTLPPTWPIPVDQLIQYISFLSIQQLAPSTISTYLAGISYYHKLYNMNDTTKSFIVTKVIEGTKRKPVLKDPRSPITLDILSKLVEALPHVCSNLYEASMFQAAFCTAFFAFLRVGEFTTKSKVVLEDRVLKVSDLLVTHADEFSILIRGSKTDQRGRSIKLVINTSAIPFKPVPFIAKFLASRPIGSAQQLFIHLDNSPLTRYQFCKILHCSIQFIGWKGFYRSHSFRIGAASEFHMRGVPDETIKLWGRWKSGAFERYIRVPEIQQVSIG